MDGFGLGCYTTNNERTTWGYSGWLETTIRPQWLRLRVRLDFRPPSVGVHGVPFELRCCLIGKVVSLEGVQTREMPPLELLSNIGSSLETSAASAAVVAKLDSCKTYVKWAHYCLVVQLNLEIQGKNDMNNGAEIDNTLSTLVSWRQQNSRVLLVVLPHLNLVSP